jgi:protein-arginine kinase
MLQRLMAYIVDFTIIMQLIFGLVANARLRLSRRLIKLVFKAYSKSEEKSKIHKEIKDHVKLAGRFNRDAALAKIVQLIKEYQMKPESMEELQSAVKTFENNEDEEWGLGKV